MTRLSTELNGLAVHILAAERPMQWLAQSPVLGWFRRMGRPDAAVRGRAGNGDAVRGKIVNLVAGNDLALVSSSLALFDLEKSSSY